MPAPVGRGKGSGRGMEKTIPKYRLRPNARVVCVYVCLCVGGNKLFTKERPLLPGEQREGVQPEKLLIALFET